MQQPYALWAGHCRCVVSRDPLHLGTVRSLLITGIAEHHPVFIQCVQVRFWRAPFVINWLQSHVKGLSKTDVWPECSQRSCRVPADAQIPRWITVSDIPIGNALGDDCKGPIFRAHDVSGQLRSTLPSVTVHFTVLTALAFSCGPTFPGGEHIPAEIRTIIVRSPRLAHSSDARFQRPGINSQFTCGLA